MYVCMYGIWTTSRELKALAQQTRYQNVGLRQRALLRHHIIGVRLPTSARRRANAKISSAQSKNAREYWQQPTLSSEDGQLAKTAN